MSKKKIAYPEHEKLAKIKNESQVIGEFLDWLQGGHEGSPNLTLCFWQEGGEEPWIINSKTGERTHLLDPEGQINPEYEEQGFHPSGARIEQLLALYFGIDLEKIDKEKDLMYKRMQEMNP